MPSVNFKRDGVTTHILFGTFDQREKNSIPGYDAGVSAAANMREVNRMAARIKGAGRTVVIHKGA